MKIYLDLVFFINFGFDFLLLLSVSYLLKRGCPIFSCIKGAFVGALSIFFLFLPLNSFSLFLLKVVISVLMILVTFHFQNKRYFIKNMVYLYLNSIVLGGGLYCLNVQFAMKQKGLIFFHNGISMNVCLLLILSPVILYFYLKQLKQLKVNYASYYQVSFTWQEKKYHMTAFLDTGNQIQDPYMKRPVLLISPNVLKNKIQSPIYIPYHAVGKDGMLSCFLLDCIHIEGVGDRKKVLVGILDDKIRMDGIEMILGTKILEG